MPCTSACRELSADGGCSLTVCRTAQALSGMSVRQQHKLRQIAAVGRVGTSGRSCARLGLGAKKLCQQALLLYSVYACRILEVSSTAIECSMALSRHTSVTGFSYTLHNCACVSHPENNTSERFARSGARFTGAGTKPWSCRHPSVLSIPPLAALFSLDLAVV